jgi:putative hydrolase of the HAD superfamily
LSAPSWEPRNLKACLFDFGGTLDSEGITWQDRFFRLYLKHGLSPDRDAFRKAFYHADDMLTETRALEGCGFRKTAELQAESVWTGLALNGSSDTLKAIIEDFIEGTRRNVESNRTLLTVLGANYRLGIVSNFYGNLEEVCEELGIRHLFQCLIDSNREGVTKPDPRIFQAALDRLRVPAAETAFVGDSVYRDMEGARNLGMPHILLAAMTQPDPKSCCPGDPVIRSLEDLGSLLLNGWNHSEQAGRPAPVRG